MKLLKLIIFTIGISIACSAQDSLTFYPLIQKTAYNLNKKQFSKGIWEPLSYAINNNIELQTYPLLNFTMPNIGAKIAINKCNATKLKFSGTHYLTYISPWLKFWQGEGTGAIITPQIDIQGMVFFESGLNVSYILNKNNIITSNLNYTFSIGPKIDKTYSVDLPLVYQRFAPAFVGSNINIKNNIQGKLYKKLSYIAMLDFYFINDEKIKIFNETSAMLMLSKTNKFKALVGSKLIYGQYPFGNQFNLIPNFNLVYTR
jgi:hypothetical protein